MDPNRDFYRTSAGAGMGIFQAFAPTGLVGILAGVFILLLLGIAGGLFQGALLIAAIVALVALVPLIGRAIKREMKRESRASARYRQEGSLPEDSSLSDEERRWAMRGRTDRRR